MRTAFEMADFILSHEVGPEIKFTSVAKAREKRRHYLADLFRPIEQALIASGDSDNVLYAITSRGMGWVRGETNTDLKDGIQDTTKAERDFQMIPIPLDRQDVNVAAAFTADRCIITSTDKKVREPIRTVPYDNITKIEPTAGKYGKLSSQLGDMTIITAIGDGVAFQTQPMSAKDRDLYREFVPEQASEAVTELVMKYKQARYAAQQGSAPQAAPQSAPQEAVSQPAAPAAPPAGAVPQDEAIEALKKFKDLLDAGILTQEEFDAKKKQLLGL